MRFSSICWVGTFICASISCGCGSQSPAEQLQVDFNVSLTDDSPSSSPANHLSPQGRSAKTAISLANWSPSQDTEQAIQTGHAPRNEQAENNSKQNESPEQTIGSSPESPSNSTSHPSTNAPAEPTAPASSAAEEGEPKFQPPFGERTNLFSPPSQTQHDSAIANDDTSTPLSIPVSDVELKGFARVTDLCAILLIEETIAPLRAGQEKGGIRVVEINPPQVVLERSEQRWTLSLSNQFDSKSRASGRRSGRD